MRFEHRASGRQEDQKFKIILPDMLLRQHETLSGVGWRDFLRMQRVTAISFNKMDSHTQVTANMHEIKGKEKKYFSTSRSGMSKAINS